MKQWFLDLYNVRGKWWLPRLGVVMWLAAVLLEAVPDIGAPQLLVQALTYVGSSFAGAVLLREAAGQLTRWLSAGGGILLAGVAQWLSLTYPASQIAHIAAALLMGLSGLWKSAALLPKPDLERASKAPPAL